MIGGASLTSVATGSLLAEALAAHGGVEAWSRVERIRVRLRFGGLAFRLRFVETSRIGRSVELRLDRPEVRFDDFPRAGRTGWFTANRVWFQRDDGTTAAECARPREHLLGSAARLLWWRDLDLLYFAGYALWNYLQGPFLLALPGVTTREIEPWYEGGERWRRLAARFPPSLPTHCAEQCFYFDRELRQRRHDYVPEVYSSRAKAAQICAGYRSFSGFALPTVRRVLPRRRDGSCGRGPVLVWIEVLDVEHLAPSADTLAAASTLAPAGRSDTGGGDRSSRIPPVNA